MPEEIKESDFGPDDEGIAEEKVEEKVAEEKPDDGTSTTEAVETEPDKTPDDGPEEGQPKPDETPEDVAKARAFFQKKSQEEIEARKVAEASLADFKADLAANDPSINFDEGVTFDEPAERPAEEPVDEDYDFEEINPRKLRSDIAGDVVQMLDARSAKERQHRIDVAYQKEVHNVTNKFVAYIEKHKVTDKLANEAVKYSQRYINTNALGAPTKRAELAAEYIDRELSRQAVKSKHDLAAKASEEADQAKINKAAGIQHPAGGGIGSPPAKTPESINKELADEITPDDPFD